MKQKQINTYQSPFVTADTAIFTILDNRIKVLLIKRKYPPFKNEWALPGVFLLKNETSQKAALRALKAKAGVKVSYLEQLYTFDSKHRDPRGHVISVSYFALLGGHQISIQKNKNLQSPTLFPIKNLPKLAFDHKNIIKYALARLRAKLEYTNVVYSLLPRYFSLSDLQKVYEIIFNQKLDKRNFRKKFLSLDLIRPTKKIISGTRARPAKLYAFLSRRPAELKKFF